MNLYDEVNMMIQRLQEAWGTLVITCDGKRRCVVSDAMESVVYEAATLIEALRMAYEDYEP